MEWVPYSVSNFYIWTSSSDGLRLELFSQEVAHKLLHYGRRDLLDVADVLGPGRHVQDREQGRRFREVRVVPQGVCHVILRRKRKRNAAINVMLHDVIVCLLTCGDESFPAGNRPKPEPPFEETNLTGFIGKSRKLSEKTECLDHVSKQIQKCLGTKRLCSENITFDYQFLFNRVWCEGTSEESRHTSAGEKAKCRFAAHF